jgi:hypothetical protein
MRSAGGDRTAALIIRAFDDPSAPDGLVVRLLDSDAASVVLPAGRPVAGVDEAVACVRAWLERFVAAGADR